MKRDKRHSVDKCGLRRSLECTDVVSCPRPALGGIRPGTLCVFSVISALILNRPRILIADAEPVIKLIFFFFFLRD